MPLSIDAMHRLGTPRAQTEAQAGLSRFPGLRPPSGEVDTMHDRYLGRIERGMDVCDVNGARIGSVTHVYRYDLARIGGADTSQQPGDEIVEVKTGFLGLGKHLYVPLRAVQDVTLDSIVLNRTADQAWQSGWDERPPQLDILR